MPQETLPRDSILLEGLPERVRACEDDPRGLLAIATELAEHGFLDQAEEIAALALLLDDTNAETWNLAAFVSHAKGRYDEALGHARKAHALNPGDLDIGKNLADIYVQAGNPREARRVRSRLRSLFPDDPDLRDPPDSAAPLTRSDRRISLGPTTTKGKVLLVVCLFEDNFGDRLIYETVDKTFRDRGFDTEPVEISLGLGESGLVERANNSDFLYFVGGGIIERWAPEIIRDFASIHPRFRRPYGVVGLSAGGFDYSEFHDSLALFCDNAAFFYTRDEESVETFRRAGAQRPPTAGVDVTLANRTLANLRRTGERVSASFRNVPYPDLTVDLDWAGWSEALKRIGARALIPDCSDAQEALALPISAQPVLRGIAESGVVVAMRYHVVLAAAMLGTLPIPVSYCPKVRRLAAQLGIEDYCLDIHEHEKLESVFAGLKANECEIRNRIAERIIHLRGRADAMLDLSIDRVEESIDGR